MKFKITLFALLPILFSSCSPGIRMNSYMFDLSKYNKEGMFITVSNSVSFEYEPVGLVQTISSGSERYIEKGQTRYKTLSQQEVFDVFVNECRKKGANAIINCEIRQLAAQSDNVSYQISGMAVRKK